MIWLTRWYDRSVCASKLTSQVRVRPLLVFDRHTVQRVQQYGHLAGPARVVVEVGTLSRPTLVCVTYLASCGSARWAGRITPSPHRSPTTCPNLDPDPATPTTRRWPPPTTRRPSWNGHHLSPSPRRQPSRQTPTSRHPFSVRGLRRLARPGLATPRRGVTSGPS